MAAKSVNRVQVEAHYPLALAVLAEHGWEAQGYTNFYIERGYLFALNSTFKVISWRGKRWRQSFLRG